VKDIFLKNLRIYILKQQKKQWSKGAGVAPYSVVGLDYANLCIWVLLKLLKIIHIGKYFYLLKNGVKPNLKVLTMKYTNATYIFYV
jgi:hypothetical protein